MSAGGTYAYGYLCSCCLIALVNDDTSGHDESCGDSHPAPMSAWEGDTPSPDYCPDHDPVEWCVNCEGAYGPADDDGYAAFSTRWCDGCGTTFAGDRYRVIQFLPIH